MHVINKKNFEKDKDVIECLEIQTWKIKAISEKSSFYGIHLYALESVFCFDMLTDNEEMLDSFQLPSSKIL